MASNNEYEQQRFFVPLKFLPINGGFDGRKTYQYTGGINTTVWQEGELPISMTITKKMTIGELIDNYPLTEFQIQALKNKYK